ncbi:MAG: ANTAR domain-containing protein [Jatrophihabitantaceae bacterium]
MSASTEGGPAIGAPTTGFQPVALITSVAAELIRSADPETVFGSLATAYSRHTATHCTVELLLGPAVRLITAPSALSSKAGESAASEQPSLSPVARQLLAGNNTSLAGADWFALPIGAAAYQVAGDQIPVGVFSCRFSHRRADLGPFESARFLLGLATELLQAERRLATAHNQVAHLEIAVNSNRDIGTAIGILMNAHLVTQDQAFTMLRTASQHSHRKLREVASEVTFTGSIGPTPPTRRAGLSG